jgi:transposase
MIGSTRQVSVWAFGRPVDMRKAFDGLYGLVKQELGRDPLCGDLFLFVGRDRTRAKVLYWDGTGLCLFAKRLERGRFAAPWACRPGEVLQLTVTELQLLLEGCALVGKISLSPGEFSLKSA